MTPAGMLAVEREATPFAGRVTVPSDVDPVVNVTEPVGVPPEPETVAVSVTLWPGVACDVLAVSVVVVDCAEITLMV